MPTLNILKNPFSIKELEQFNPETGTRVIDWLVENYPNGCGGSVKVYVNGKELPLDDADYAMQQDDRVVIAVNPTGTGFVEAFLISLAVSAIMTAVSIGLTLLLKKPDPPAFSKPEHAQPSPVYSIRTSQNTARLGEPVPVVYGTILHTPDICAQPYRFYGANKQDEFFDMLLCLGVGEFTILDTLLGDTRIADIEAGVVNVQVVPRSVHGGVLGTITQDWGSGVPFVEDMVTSLEVGDQEFLDNLDQVGYFRCGKAGQKGRFIYIEIAYPQGLYQVMDAGEITTTNCGGYIRVMETDANGVHSGTYIDKTFLSFTVGFGGGVWNRGPHRETFAFDMGRSAYWAVQMTRTYNREFLPGVVNPFTWVGLRMKVDHVAGTPAYGNTTLMAVRMKATQLAETSERQLRVKLSRKLPILGAGALTVTSNPADAYMDILMNMDYGAQRPITEIDTLRLAPLRAYWAPAAPNNVYQFNSVYTGKTTVWEALAQVLVPFGAAPLPIGGFMSVMQDGKKTARTMLFSEQNIVQDSFKLQYSFDDIGAPDGIEVEYRDPITFAPSYALYPSGSVDPERIDLFGCTNKRHAEEFALLQWQRRNSNRRAVSFETEMEGLIPGLGEHVAVQHTLPFWGQSGFVVGVTDDRLHITVDRNLKWADVPGPYIMLFRDNQGGVSKQVVVTRDGADNKILLTEDPWAGLDTDWSLTLAEEVTHFAWGNALVAVKDFILTGIGPKGGGRVTMEGVYYDVNVFNSTLYFLSQEVPY